MPFSKRLVSTEQSDNQTAYKLYHSMSIFSWNTELYFSLLYIVAFEPDMYFALRSSFPRMLSRDLKENALNLDSFQIYRQMPVQFSFFFVSSSKQVNHNFKEFKYMSGFGTLVNRQ